MFDRQNSLGMVMVSGLGRGTPSMFAGTAMHSMGPSYSLGATGAEWYQRAKQAEANFQALMARTARVANKTVRDQIVDWIGAPGSVDTPMERYNTLILDSARAETYTPLNTTEYDRSQLQNRITKLESYNNQLKEKVSDAEAYYGILPEPVVIEKFVNVPGAPASAGMNWAIPVAVGVGAIALLALAAIFKA